MQNDHHHSADGVDLPTPTAWPIIAAFGLSLVFLGLVTNLLVSAVGFITGLIGAVGWFSDVFPHPKHEFVPLKPEAERTKPVRSTGRVVQMLVTGEHVENRAHLPTEVHPYRMGVIGGLAGGAVMAILAAIAGLVKYGSIWYPLNLLAATGVPSLAEMSLEQLHHFSITGFIVGIIAHVSISVLVGLLYAVAVPMMPRKLEWLFGGIFIPLVWTALIFGTLGLISPKLEAGIDWFWFVVCQIAFGLVCGYVVYKSGKIETMQNWSIAQKLGVESMHRTEEKKS